MMIIIAIMNDVHLVKKEKKKLNSNIYFPSSLFKVAKYDRVQCFSDFLTHEFIPFINLISQV